jgi:hypothetical protein
VYKWSVNPISILCLVYSHIPKSWQYYLKSSIYFPRSPFPSGFPTKYCRVLPGNATNNLWVLNLTLGLFEYSPGRTTVSRFTILPHINFTVDSSVRCLLRSPLNWFLLSTDASLSTNFTLHSSLSVSSVSHPLKVILCSLEREHLLEPFSSVFWCNYC